MQWTSHKITDLTLCFRNEPFYCETSFTTAEIGSQIKKKNYSKRIQLA